ncbi:MAG: hypothetical protein U0871_01490 [Gemmataceae bacterium]
MTPTDPTGSATLTRLLSVVPADRRPTLEALLTDPHRGGHGLRAWLAILDLEGRPLPDELPAELVDVYLADDEAEPLHDCEECGLPVPVRAGRRCGHEAAVERVYFPTCPHCGGRTGRYAYWSRSA